MWGPFIKLLQLLAKYGKRAVDWAWANKDLIFKWIGQGAAIDWIVRKIKQILGIK